MVGKDCTFGVVNPGYTRENVLFSVYSENSFKKGEKMLTDAQKQTLQDTMDELFLVQVEVMPSGRIPSKAHPTDCGFDLYATSDLQIQFGEIVKHPLNIKLQLPSGTYGEITSKSSLGSKGLLVYAGIIDEGYRGIPHVICTCLKKDETITIRKGEKIAQLILHPFSPNYRLVQVTAIRSETDRGESGFGASGA